MLESHRSALVRKDPEFYRKHFPDVAPDIDYFWPVRGAAVLEREEKQRENARLRQARAEQKILDELAKAKRKRSAAAKRGWKTRAANARKTTSEARRSH